MKRDEELEALLKLAWQRQIASLIVNHDLGALLNLAWRLKLAETHVQAQERMDKTRASN